MTTVSGSPTNTPTEKRPPKYDKIEDYMDDFVKRNNPRELAKLNLPPYEPDEEKRSENRLKFILYLEHQLIRLVKQWNLDDKPEVSCCECVLLVLSLVL